MEKYPENTGHHHDSDQKTPASEKCPFHTIQYSIFTSAPSTIETISENTIFPASDSTSRISNDQFFPPRRDPAKGGGIFQSMTQIPILKRRHALLPVFGNCFIETLAGNWKLIIENSPGSPVGAGFNLLRWKRKEKPWRKFCSMVFRFAGKLS
jgi:hypothetical protein